MQRRGGTGQAAKGRRTKRPKARKVPAAPASFADRDELLDQRTRERDEAREQLAATSGVLRVISRSAFDLQAVFDSLVESAARLCRADFASIRLNRDGFFHHVANCGYSPEQNQYMNEHPVPAKPDRGSIVGRVLSAGKAVQIEDTKADPEFRMTNIPGFENVHTHLGVPLLREGKPIGALVLMRGFVEAFTAKQIELVETFAAQAVIAIENTRLLNELRQRTDDLSEALEQQTATSEVLKIISSSPGELEPVFHSMLENATRICGAKFGNLFLREADGYRAATAHGDPTFVERWRRTPFVSPRDAPLLDRVTRTKQVLHIPDLRHEQSYRDGIPRIVALVDSARARTFLSVPMLKESEVVGTFAIYRQEVQPFTDKQIELVQNFAAQAVIAIENTRLLNELRQRTDDLSESLQQQTATTDVLKVISSSPGELEAVFNAMLENAVRICQAKFGIMLRFVGEEFYAVARLNIPQPLDDFMRKRGQRKAIPGSDLDNLYKSKQVVHTIDMLAAPVPSPPAKLAGGRTQLAVPMLMMASWSERLLSTGRRSVHSRTSRSSWFRTSPLKPSSPSKIHAYSMNCASALTISRNRWNSRPRHRRCLKLFRVQRAICNQYFRPCWKMRRDFARRNLAFFIFVRATHSVWWRTLAPILPISNIYRSDHFGQAQKLSWLKSSAPSRLCK